MSEHKDFEISSFTVEALPVGDISVFFHSNDQVLINLEDGRVIEIDRHGNFAVRWYHRTDFYAVSHFPEE